MTERNLITDVAGLRVGHASNGAAKTGVTVLTAAAPFVAGISVMGGAPGTRETDLLRPDATVEAVDALVLSGGSAFGLSAADGVMRALAEEGRGYPAAGHRVPIVPAAILFDLESGGGPRAPGLYSELGHRAYRAASADVALGSVGAGTGAVTAGLKGGLGSASATLPSGATVGALVAVNALGQATVGDGPHFWAAPFEQGDEFGGLGPSPLIDPPVKTKHATGGNTTLAIVATDLALTKAEATRLATAAHDGIARALVPSHTPMDGDLVFACATGARETTDEDRLLVGHVAAITLARAIARGVFSATEAEGDVAPTWAARFG